MNLFTPDNAKIAIADVYNMTPKQYHASKMKRISKEYGLSVAEVREEYDTEAARNCDNGEWIEAVRAAAREGKELSRQTLDRLFELGKGRIDWNPLTQLLHDCPNARIPNGYMVPSARKTI